ncbi:unnamed protein product [Vitrella brassicaformis CCMP3155]|uniref:Uncharacterized protein n=1 Tax=Vitrella brassicaformis (strain CCMP3155) TaxID=1169540 RepID=A0A0G4FH77_VITBC|nr:unnamed protein product [Vitrella brassicaformis CCMP3155]|eukprot:CEM12863.1 unnamed protein product [Vitrella brassicaformis CCMP3155]
MLEVLRRPTGCYFRSTRHLTKERAIVSVDNKMQVLTIASEKRGDPIKIVISKISRLQAQLYTDLHAEEAGLPVLVIGHPPSAFPDPSSPMAGGGSPGSGHGRPALTLLEFRDERERDNWESALRSLLESVASPTASGHYHPVSLDKAAERVVLQPITSLQYLPANDPRAGPNLVQLEVGLGSDQQYRTAVLTIQPHETSGTKCKRRVVEFVEENGVNENELVPLYRYVRMLVQRAMVERETPRMLQTLRENSFMRRRQEREAQDRTFTIRDDRQLLRYCNANLDRLKAEIPIIFSGGAGRINVDEHGVINTCIAESMLRSIKMKKALNERQFRVLMAVNRTNISHP